jgi:hypothetical protein
MSDGVVEHGAVDDVGQAAFQRSHRFHRGLAVDFATVVVGGSFGRVPELDGGHDVQGPVICRFPALDRR